MSTEAREKERSSDSTMHRSSTKAVISKMYMAKVWIMIEIRAVEMKAFSSGLWWRNHPGCNILFGRDNYIWRRRGPHFSATVERAFLNPKSLISLSAKKDADSAEFVLLFIHDSHSSF